MPFFKDKKYWLCVLKEFNWFMTMFGTLIYIIVLIGDTIKLRILSVLVMTLPILWFGYMSYKKSTHKSYDS